MVDGDCTFRFYLLPSRHIEGTSTLFGTILNYIALRILGIDACDDRVERAKKFILANGTALHCPQWGKFFMCTLGIMEWECMTPVLPELWLLPTCIPIIHPSSWWCHSRVVYLSMAYVYGKKYSLPLNGLTICLRKELYNEKYENIKWNNHKFQVAKCDQFSPLSWFCKLCLCMQNLMFLQN